MESVASTIGLVVVPLGHELVARTGVFGAFTRVFIISNRMTRNFLDSSSSGQSDSDRDRMSSKTEVFTLFLGMESVGISTTSSVIELLAGSCGWLIVV